MLCDVRVFAAVVLGLAWLVPLAAQQPGYSEGFDAELSGWELGDKDKNPLLVVADRKRSGQGSAYSGPPGGMRVSKYTFPLRWTGRLEVWFYDDMAGQKHQIALVANREKGDLLGIVCRGGERYQVRVGTTYTDVPVARSEGWHEFAWECDGARTVAFIDGREVFRNGRLDRIAFVALGSYWDASTGWYDDLKTYPRPPTHAGPLVEAEDLYEQTGPPGARIRVVPKKGASNLAFSHWDRKGHALSWAIRAATDGEATLLFKYATMSDEARRNVNLGEREYQLRLPRTGAWDAWRYAGLPVDVRSGVLPLRMENTGGSCNLDWIALAPAGVDPTEYGELLDRHLRVGAWYRAAAEQTGTALRRAGLSVPDDLGGLSVLAALPPPARLEAMLADRDAPLRAARETVLAAERTQLRGSYRVRPTRPLGPVTPLAREYYRRLLRYLRYTAPQIKDWPCAPGCRYHKSDGHREWDVRQNATVALGYAVLLTGEFDEMLTGVPREQVADDLVALLRYIAITHKANFLPTGDGQTWGDQWQSALWAHWAGQAAWIAWDLLDDDVKLMVARMVTYEADRFNERPPDSGYRGDTKAEENAWNSMVIALAECMFPDHPHHDLWHERAIVYMINSFTRDADGNATAVVDGKPAAERITAVTLHPDFTLENHHRVHPDYLATTGLVMRNRLLYHAAGVAAPQSCDYNVPRINAIVKRLTAVNGTFFYVNGQDWWPHRHGSPLLVAGFASLLFDDPQMAYLERAGLGFMARMHRRFENGRLWDPREYNYKNAEEEIIARYATLYLLHRYLGDGPEPVSKAVFLESQSGVAVHEIGGFATHRTPHKFCSFAWVNGAMGLIVPDDDTWLISPSERGLVGTIAVVGAKDSTPKALAHKVATDQDYLAVAARVSRCEGKIEQRLAMVSLPDRPVIYLERLIARQAVRVREVATGAIGVLNEDAPGISPNVRTIYHATGQEQVVGASGWRERTLSFDSSWANIDGRMGVLGTTGTIGYRDTNSYRRSRLEEMLYANYRDNVGSVPADEVFSESAAAFLPGQIPNATRGLTLAFAATNGVLTATLGQTVVMANLGDDTAAVELGGRKVTLEPLEVAVAER